MVIPKLVNRISADQAPGLVVDDFHQIANSEIASQFATFVELAPPGFRIAIGARTQPDLPVARWKSSGILAVIGDHDLRFSTSEAHQFLTSKLGRNLEQETLDEIVDMAEGWIAGVHLLALAAPSLDADRDIASYLESEVLADLPPAIQDLLVVTSILDPVSPQLADELSGRSDSHNVLLDLATAGMFVDIVGRDPEAFRYHGLLRSALQARLDRDPDRQRDVRTAPRHGPTALAITATLWRSTLQLEASMPPPASLRITGSRP